MSAYKTIELGTLNQLPENSNGKAFLHDALELTSCEISVNVVPQGWEAPFRHRHKQNEEVYIILAGEGEFEVESEKIPVKEGSCLKVAPQAVRTLKNTGASELRFLCVQAKEGSLEQYAMTDGEIC